MERIIADVEENFRDVAIDPVAGAGNLPPSFDHNPIIGEWNGIPEADDVGDEDDQDIYDEDDDDLVGGDGLSGHGHRFEVVDEHLDLLGASKFGKDNTEATIVFMVDDYEEEDEAYFDIVVKLSNITWNGRRINTYTIDSVDLPDLDDYDESMIPDSAADIDRLKEDAKRLLPRLKIDNNGELEI